MLTIYFGSTGTMTATLRNLAGAAVTGATVTLTIRDDEGTAIVTDASMADAGGGTYTYTIASNLLTDAGHIYSSTVTATKSGETRLMLASILLAYDED